MRDSLPPQFVQNITGVFHEGAHWLARLPETLAEVAARWSLTVGAAVPNLSFNYVCFATRADGAPVVLKLCVPRDEIVQEIAALQLYNAGTAVQLLEADPDRGWLLLERLTPGTPLSALTDDDEATRILATTIQPLWVAPPENSPFRPISEWGDGFINLRTRFNGGTGPFPESLIARAEVIFAQPVTNPVLVHGDYHHDNVLRRVQDSREEWVVIDPKGMVGDRLYDASVLLYNPFPYMEAQSPATMRTRLARRVAILAECLEAEPAEIIESGIAQAMLSQWWTYETFGGDVMAATEIRVAQALAAL